MIIYFLPVALVFWFMNTFYVNVPFWDEWSLIPFFEKIANGSANFADFFSQHNEHRMLFPKMIFTALSFPFDLNLYIYIFFSLSIVVLTFISIHKITNLGIVNENKYTSHIFNILNCFFLFSLIQYENWLWGFQIAWFFINACVVISVVILVIAKKLNPNIRFLLSGLCCVIASFSSAHGLLSWLALIPSVLSIEGNTNKKIKRLGIWMALFIVCFIIYTIGYQKPGHHPDILFFLKHPLISGGYILTIIGFPLGTSLLLSQLIGLFILLSFSFFNFYCLRNYKSEFTLYAVPWLSIGWFATLFAGMTTVGRSGFGVEQAMASRYTSVLILLSISCVNLYRLFISHNIKDISITKIYVIPIRIFLSSILIIFFISSNSHAIAEAHNISLSRRTGKTCLEVVKFLDQSFNDLSNSCLNLLYPNAARLKDYAKKLEKIGFREFPKNIVFQDAALKSHGYIDIPRKTEKLLTFSKNDTLKIVGWAILPEKKQQPNVVLISYDNQNSFFSSGNVRLDRPDVAKAFNSSLYRKSGWEANVSLKTIPLGEHFIKVWVYDQDFKQFIKLNGQVKINII